MNRLTTIIEEYTSFSELLKEIDKKLNVLKQQLGTYLRKLEDVRAKAEQEKKLKEILKAIAGEEVATPTASKTINLKDIRLLINPPATEESTILEDLIGRINKSVQALQVLRKHFEPLASVDVEDCKILINKITLF